MQRFRVTALRPVTLNVELEKDAPPVQIELPEGGSSLVRQVFRIPGQDDTPATEIVPHPAELGQRVRVAGAIELVRVL